MSGVRCVVWDEWCEMSSVWDGWCEMNGVRWRRWVVYDGERWVVRDECICEVLCEMNEMSGVRWWWEMSDVRWVDEDERSEVGGVRTATPNDLYTQQAAKAEWQDDINTKFSHLLLAQLPRTQFAHGKAPNPHARKTSAQNFCISYWHSYPEHSLHTARRQTRMPGRHQRKIFASPIGTAIPRTLSTRSKAPNPHARKTSTQNFRISYWHSYPQHFLHTARRQTRMPGRHQRTIFASPIGTATPSTVYTQQGAEPACHEDINAQNLRISYWRSYPEHTLHTARRHTRMPGTHQRKIFASPMGTATPNTIYTQQDAKPACHYWGTRLHTARRQTRMPGRHQRKIFASPIGTATPNTLYTARRCKAPNPHARKTSAQNFCISYWHSYPQHSLHTARRQIRMRGRHQRKIFASPIGTATRASGDRARRNPFWRLWILRLPQTGAAGQRRAWWCVSCACVWYDGMSRVMYGCVMSRWREAGGDGRRTARRVSNQKQLPHTEMWGISHKSLLQQISVNNFVGSGYHDGKHPLSSFSMI